MNNSPIGMFDSGVGGLTLVKEVLKRLPNEEIIYFGDTARNPYGPKSSEEILKFSREIVAYLVSKGAKAIIIACNTATVRSIDILQKEYDIPIIGVVEPAVLDVVSSDSTHNVGLIATESTVKSKLYDKKIKENDSNINIFSKACPELVDLAEEGIFNNEESDAVVKECLEDLLKENIDTLVLGCTHFPLHLEDIKKNIPATVRIVNPAFKTIEVTSNILKDQNLLREDMSKPQHEFMCSGDVEGFTDIFNIIFEDNSSVNPSMIRLKEINNN